MSKTLYIINPAGHGGVGPKVWEEFKTLWPDPIHPEQVVITERPGHAREIVASTKDYDIFTAVGGDGTVGDVISGIMEHPEPRPRLAIIPAGTGNDIGRNAGVNSVDDAASALHNERTKTFDLMRVDYQVDDQPTHRYAFLAGVIGFSSIPMIRPWMKRLLGPKGAYYLATMMEIIRYRLTHMTVYTEEQEYSDRSWLVIVGNSERSAGNSMCLAPGARIDDGMLNVTIFPPHSKYKMASKLLPKIASGTHINEPGISYFASKRIEIASTPPAIFELDGDLFGTTPVTFTVCPRILQIISL
jgi:diacylglycerol kinase (ATP)